jgi:hypothetical protein
MSQQPQEVSFQEYVGMKRNQIVLAYEQAKEIATKNYDDIVQKLAQEMLKSATPATPEKPAQEIVPVEKNKNKK